MINNPVLLVFLFFGPTLFGMFLAYLLDKNIRGSRIYQSVFYTPVVLSLAVVGFIWQSVDLLDRERARHRAVRRRRSRSTGSATRSSSSRSP